MAARLASLRHAVRHEEIIKNSKRHLRRWSNESENSRYRHLLRQHACDTEASWSAHGHKVFFCVSTADAQNLKAFNLAPCSTPPILRITESKLV